jgi:hypothetical protein
MYQPKHSFRLFGISQLFFLFSGCAYPGPPPVFMGAHVLFEQRHLALVAEILV